MQSDTHVYNNNNLDYTNLKLFGSVLFSEAIHFKRLLLYLTACVEKPVVYSVLYNSVNNKSE